MYLFFIGIILCAAGAYMWYRGRKWEKENIQIIETKYKKQIDEDLKYKQKEFEDFREFSTREIDSIIQSKEDWENRALEAEANTQRLLKSESQRLTAEIQRQKEVEEIKLEQQLEKRQQALDLLYTRQYNDLEKNYQLQKEKLDSEILLLKSVLDEFKAKQDAVNEAILRQKELEEKEDFYSIQISESDREDIRVLQSMDLQLHNRDAIPKLIWELYIRRPTQEMIKRVTNGRKISGIYKITNKKTGEAYVGKTTDIATRWQNHNKTAIGLDGCARTTLHSRLAQDGVWSYTWEILEQVDKDHLAARETFYINLYDTTKQLNMKSGEKNGTQ